MEIRNKESYSCRRWIWWFFLFGAAAVLILLLTTTSFAADKTEVTLLKTLKEYGLDSISDVGTNLLRSMGYSCIKFLGEMTDGLYGSIGTIYKYLSFGSSEQLTGLVTRYSVLYKTIFSVSIVFLGIYFINGKNTNQLNTVNCIIIIAMVVIAMPLFTQKMTKLTVSSADYARHQWTESAKLVKINSVASSIFTSNLVDLKKVDKNISGEKITGLKKDKGFNSLQKGNNDWRMIDINEVMDYEDDDFNSEIWKSKIEMEDSGEYKVVDLDGWIIDSYYYRYQVVSWFNIITEMLAAVIILFFVCIKCGKLVVDIAMSAVYTPFVAITDLTTGQRTKECIKNLFVLYATIFMCVALVGVYFAGFSFINENVKGIFPKMIMHLALAWATLDGPSVLERITGVDVGSKGVWQKLMGARAAVGLAGGTAKMASATGKAVGKVSNTAGNVFVGKDKMEQGKDKMRESKNKVVQKATDGKGLYGFTKNAVKGIEERMTPTDSTKGIEMEARKADPNIGQTQHEGQIDNGKISVPGTDGSQRSIKRPAIARADRSEDNLNHGMKQTTNLHKENRQSRPESLKSQKDFRNIQGGKKDGR